MCAEMKKGKIEVHESTHRSMPKVSKTGSNYDILSKHQKVTPQQQSSAEALVIRARDADTFTPNMNRRE